MSFFLHFKITKCNFLALLCSFVQEIQSPNCNIYNMNEVVIQTFFPSVNKQAVLKGKYGPRTLFEASKVAGSATYKQREFV